MFAIGTSGSLSAFGAAGLGRTVVVAQGRAMSRLKRYRSVVADSARWEGFVFRAGDIVMGLIRFDGQAG
jgi:hypothetical protein